jgi:hypothetical protein
MRCSAPEFFPNCTADRIRAVGNYREMVRVKRAAATMSGIECVVAGPKVAVAAGLRNHSSAVKQPGHAI